MLKKHVQEIAVIALDLHAIKGSAFDALLLLN
jgi:hypothetical protein